MGTASYCGTATSPVVREVSPLEPQQRFVAIMVVGLSPIEARQRRGARVTPLNLQRGHGPLGARLGRRGPLGNKPSGSARPLGLLEGRPRLQRLGLWLAFTLVSCRGGAISQSGEGEAGSANGLASPSSSAPAPAEGTEPGSAGAVDANSLSGSATLGPGANAPLVSLRTAIEQAAARTGVSANVLGGVIWAESRADPATAGGGLMQIGSNEFAAMQKQYPAIIGTLQDAGANAMAGAYYLTERRQAMQLRYNRSDLGIVLRAYNSGDNGVDPSNLRALPAGTGDANYVRHVESYVAIIQSGSGTLPP